MKFVSRLTAVASVAAALAVSTPAAAQMVTFSTLGQFTGACNSGAASMVATCTLGSTSITFTGVSNNSVFGPSNLSFGDFQSVAPNAAPQSYAGVTFTMFVSQSVPSASAGVGQAVVGNFNGNLQQNNSQVNFLPAPQNFNLGTGQTASYIVFNTQIAPPSTSGGNTTVNGFVTVNPNTTVPEPTTYALMAAGLAALAVVSRRRRVA